jgi:crotonobetainyl-CoA:carnitine CoA-transferase CaiB-like acyl-CoA transferase
MADAINSGSRTANLPQKNYAEDAPAPLDGIRVLDLSRLVSGNMVTMQLADFGAEVIKVERPGHGDDLRNWRVAGHSVHFKQYCRNKLSITLDPRGDAGRELLLKLVATAHVLVENFRPGTLEKWGLGVAVLHAQNPKLIVVRVSGWGQDGPKRDEPGYGSLIEGRSGFAAMNGFADRPPLLPPLALADMVAGIQGAYAVMIALRAVEVSGQAGQVVDVSLFEPLHSTLGPNAAIYQLTGSAPTRTGNRSETTAPRNAYRCKDGKYVALSASMQAMAERLFHAMGRPELIDDPRFKTNADRVANNDELDPIVANFMASRTQAELVEFFTERAITVGPIYNVDDLLEDEFVLAREILANYPDNDMGTMPMTGIAARLTLTPGQIRRPAPELGEHNEQVFGGVGITADALAQLRADNVI